MSTLAAAKVVIVYRLGVPKKSFRQKHEICSDPLVLTPFVSFRAKPTGANVGPATKPVGGSAGLRAVIT